MSDLFAVSLAEMIACVEREVAMRESVYPRQVANGKMTPIRADRELRAMRAVLDHLRAAARSPELTRE